MGQPLTNLEFGRGYWINVSRPVTLQLQVASGEPISGTAAVAAALTNPVSRRTPPAVYYGTLPAAAMSGTITAWIDGKLCGKGRVVLDEQSYIVKVDAADEGATAGCGAPGKQVSFKFLDGTVVNTVDWDNTAPVKVDLKAAAPSPNSCRELILNGGFEDNRGWTQAGRLGSSSISATQPASGRRSLLLGGTKAPAGSGTGGLPGSVTAYQRLSIPRDAGKVVLSFRYKSSGKASNQAAQKVRLLQPGRAVELMEVQKNSTQWRDARFDLSAFKGQQVLLIFEVAVDDPAKLGGTWMAVDDVSVQACR